MYPCTSTSILVADDERLITVPISSALHPPSTSEGRNVCIKQYTAQRTRLTAFSVALARAVSVCACVHLFSV